VKKHNTAKTTARRAQLARVRKLTIGMDLGDRVSRYCILNEAGDIVFEGSVSTTKSGMNQVFGSMPRCRIAMETGAHSPWVSRQLSAFGHEVIVANARNVRLITESTRKDDRLDAKTLARLARIDPQLLCPVRHHSAEGQAHLSVVRARATLVSVRTTMVNAARGLAKPHGERLRRCGTQQVGKAMATEVSTELRTALEPLLTAVEGLNEQIQVYDRQIEQMAKEQYPEVRALQQVDGVGTLIALSYVLTIEDPHRFRRSRDVGCFFGLRPGRRNSGNSQPQMHISKEGDRYLRTLMVQGAHHILGPFGKDCDLRRWGLKLAERGGKNAKKRAIVAVARKLAVLLHRLWVSGEVYDPLRNSQASMAGKAA
jgi:transposase